MGTRGLGQADRIGVGIIGMPRILRTVITSILMDQPDIEVVGELPEDADLAAVEALGATLFTVGLGRTGELPAAAEHLLADHAAVRMLGLSREGRLGYLYTLQPHREPVGEVSPETLLAAIRSAVRST
jgi:hypothetical protein